MHSSHAILQFSLHLFSISGHTVDAKWKSTIGVKEMDLLPSSDRLCAVHSPQGK
jgi:hypothetical protein